MADPLAYMLDEATKRMEALYGENRRIEDDAYDEACAVKCVNGTFVGKNNDGILAFKGIPYVGKQPTGDLRWKAPVDYTADDGVYEAYYFGRIPRQMGDASCDAVPPCLYGVCCPDKGSGTCAPSTSRV